MALSHLTKSKKENQIGIFIIMPLMDRKFCSCLIIERQFALSWSFSPFQYLQVSFVLIQSFLKPSIFCTRHLINLWSPSTLLFKYLHRLILILFIHLLLKVLIASLLAPLWSMLINFGQPFCLISLIRNLWAANLFRRLISRKSTVFPSLSTSRYKYIHSPFTLI